MIRRYGQIRQGQVYRPRPGAYALLIRGGQVLMTRQDVPEPDYQLPGGGIEPGESVLAGLHREVAEETGWRIQPLHRIATFRRHCFMPDYGRFAEKICHVWLARPLYRTGPPSEPGHSAVWVPGAEVAALLCDPGSRDVARMVLGLRGIGRKHYRDAEGSRSIRTADMSSMRLPLV